MKISGLNNKYNLNSITHKKVLTENSSNCPDELDSISKQKNQTSFTTFGQLQSSVDSNALSRLTTSQTNKNSNTSFAKTRGYGLYFSPNINYQISFKALKKTKFDGIDFSVIEKFKAPIEKFNSKDDLQIWAKKQAINIANTDFGGRQQETKLQRKKILKSWIDYIIKGNSQYNSTTALLILNAITKKLKPDNDMLPPLLNKDVLAACISEIEKKTQYDKKYQFDLNKMYQTRLLSLYLDNPEPKSGNTGWIVIPSQKNDPDHYEDNVEKLKTLSHKNWCTKTFNAAYCLCEGDFHIYFENNQPKLGLRFLLDEILEIQGEKNNFIVPFEYIDEIKKYVNENGLKLTDNAKYALSSSQKAIEEITKIKEDLKSAIENNDVKAIFKYFKIDVQEDSDGFLTISSYKQPSAMYSFSDIGIDENILIERVKKIKKFAYFQNSQIKSLKNIETIGGNATFGDSQITDLGKLKTISGNADFTYSQLVNLGNLKMIKGQAYFQFSKITDLENLEIIGSNAHFTDSKVKNLGKLKTVGGNVYIQNSNLFPNDFEDIEFDNIYKYANYSEDRTF